ncbi:hypothetical protein [Tomitella fengzijianii]|uniref:Uncharacterized protein n=1 Tax=Tomitella fengzijianii TaxID=2597660 RepID=A0A516X4V2_9ACTN|nr:hypothetical protein [Tomitella fengzijianii]QDQ98105.1 hypothetical protein FO059_13275 [Tomitella fengzijianii]
MAADADDTGAFLEAIFGKRAADADPPKPDMSGNIAPLEGGNPDAPPGLGPDSGTRQFLAELFGSEDYQ